MDLKQVEYILKIAEENNITRAAEKLFITQSALNQQLLKLERELDTPLFYRSRTNWRPTEAGEVYIRNAKELLRIRKPPTIRSATLPARKRNFNHRHYPWTRYCFIRQRISHFPSEIPLYHRRANRTECPGTAGSDCRGEPGYRFSHPWPAKLHQGRVYCASGRRDRSLPSLLPSALPVCCSARRAAGCHGSETSTI